MLSGTQSLFRDVHGFLITLLMLAFLQHYHQSLESSVFKTSSDCFSQQLITTYHKKLAIWGLKSNIPWRYFKDIKTVSKYVNI